MGNNEVYDTITNTWNIKKPIPTPRDCFGIATYDTKIFVIGGGIPTTRINEVYDISTDSWESKTPMPTSRVNVEANYVNGKIYVMAGKNFTEYYWPVLCNQTEIYDVSTDSWTTGASMPDFYGMGPEIASKSENVASSVFENKIYVLVGQTLHIYDPEKDVWTYGPDIPNPTLNGPAICFTTGLFAPKRLHIFGNGFGQGIHFVYDLELQEWSFVTPIPNSRYWVKIGVVDDILYSIGGGINDENGYISANSTERYVPLGYIPEFSLMGILPIFLIASIVIIVCKKKLNIL